MFARTRSIWLAVGGLSILAWTGAASADGPARRVEVGRDQQRTETHARAETRRVVTGREVGRTEYRVLRLDSEADIEGLEATLRWSADRWELQVGYKVEVEDMLPCERFEVAFRVAEGGIPLLDENGQPMTITVPLDCPTEVDDDELEFRDSFGLDLPDEAIRDAGNLRVYAKVVRVTDGKVLDREDDSIRCLSHRPIRVIVESGRRVQIVRHTSVTVHRTMRFSRAAVGRTVVRQVPVVPVAVARPISVARPMVPVSAARPGLHVGVGVSVRR